MAPDRIVAQSVPQTEYYPLVAKGKLLGLLVDEFVSSLNKAMPEAVAHTTERLSL